MKKNWFEISDKYDWPADCDCLLVPKVNSVFYENLSHGTRSSDLRIVNFQKILRKPAGFARAIHKIFGLKKINNNSTSQRDSDSLKDLTSSHPGTRPRIIRTNKIMALDCHNKVFPDENEV